jgi:hypothetical protein
MCAESEGCTACSLSSPGSPLRERHCALPQHPVEDGHILRTQSLAHAAMEPWEIHTLNPVVIVKVFRQHAVAVSDAMAIPWS